MPVDGCAATKRQQQFGKGSRKDFSLGRPAVHKAVGDLYEQRGLYPEAVEEYRAAQLIANQDAGTPTMPLEPSSLPAADDLEAWKQLAASLKGHTDAYKDELRLQITPPPMEIGD